MQRHSTDVRWTPAELYLGDQRIPTGMVESMINRVIGRRMAKKQPMRWSRRGAHRLVQIRVAVRGRTLGSSISTVVPAV
jgi:hypothetical protein